MHAARIVRFFILGLCVLLVMPGAALAQAGRAQLVGRSVLPAALLTDGTPAGTALTANGAIVNGIKVPFDSQPVGTISGLLPGQYPGTWLVLFSGQFDTPPHSADYLLRFYVVELGMRQAGGGQGEVNLLDRLLLADSNKKISQPIANGNTPTRYLTGADFAPRAFQRAGGGSFWVAEERGPSLLRFDSVGKLLEPPIALDEAGALQGMSILPDDSALIIAQRASNNRKQVVFRAFDLTTRQITALPGMYNLDSESYSVGSLAMVNHDEALVLEQDDQQNNRAQFKRIFVVNLRANPIQKTLVADLLNIDDPNGISQDSVFKSVPKAFGLGKLFKFPFSSITAMYPSDEQTLIVANNNHVPYGLGRSTAQADATEFIAIRLSQPVALDPAFLRPMQ